MKKNLLALGIILMSALTFTACSDDDDFYGVSPKTQLQAYTLKRIIS